MDEAPLGAPSPLEDRTLVFRSAGLLCAFPLHEVREVVLLAQLSRPPGMPAVLEGILNLRGTAVPIVNFNRLFALPERPSGLHTPVMILQGPSGLTGVLVEAVSHVLSTAGLPYLPVRASHSFNQCATAEIHVDETAIHLLSPQRIFLEEEHRSIAEFQSSVQTRLATLRSGQS